MKEKDHGICIIQIFVKAFLLCNYFNLCDVIDIYKAVDNFKTKMSTTIYATNLTLLCP